MKIPVALQQRFSQLVLRRKKQRETLDGVRKLVSKSDATDIRVANEISQYEMDDLKKEAEILEDKENLPPYAKYNNILMALSGDGSTTVTGTRHMALPAPPARCDTCQKRELAQRMADGLNDEPSATSQHRFPALPTNSEDEVKIPTPPRSQGQLTAQPGSSRSELDDGLSVRNASNQTAVSDTSNTTVHHDPSKRCPSFIPRVDTRFHDMDINPFTDRNAINRGSRMSSQEERSITSRSKHGNEGPSSDYGGSITAVSSSRYAERSSESTGVRMVSGKASRSSSNISRRILASTDPERRERKRSKALLAYNASAEILGLNSLTSLKETRRPVTEASTKHGEIEESPAKSLFHRLRNAKSTLTMKQKGVKQTLRRMRTMANMRADFPLGSLKGKSLEDITRLGGESIINMPTPYGPGPLRLPTCIAAPVFYLQENGPSVQYLYVNPGNPSVVSALYHHYAKQVLGTVRAKDIISKTTRSIQLPLDILNIDGAPRRNEDCLYDVATFFRQLLSELPGGILGSSYLFQVLKQIHGHNFTPETVLRDPGRREYVWDTPPSSGAQVRMITLALVALMNDAQLELASAVFGLLSLTLEESRLRQVFHSDHIHPGGKSCSQCRGYPSADVLASAFAPMLYDTQSVPDDDLLRRPVNPSDGQAEAVVIMLMKLWRLVVLQLRQWEIIGSG